MFFFVLKVQITLVYVVIRIKLPLITVGLANVRRNFLASVLFSLEQFAS